MNCGGERCASSSSSPSTSSRSSSLAGGARSAGISSLICPTFVLPYRRYASLSLLPLARSYLEQDGLSYQQAVAPGGRVLGYVTPPGQEEIDERALHRCTLWRFLLFLGAQIAALQEGIQLWEEHDPSSGLHRFLAAVSPRKYRSEIRGEILRTARRLLHLIDRWDRAFGKPFFPRFATRPRVP
jgi:hypothetical protein